MEDEIKIKKLNEVVIARKFLIVLIQNSKNTQAIRSSEITFFDSRSTLHRKEFARITKNLC